MKKLFITLSILSVVSTVSASINTNLKYSMRGSEVSELQEFLIDRGFITGNSTGFFGLLTLKAVKQYQSSVSLPSTGYVGAMTREKINTELLAVVDESTRAEVEETGTTTPIIAKVAYDVCPNIEGTQSVVPVGMFMDSVKGCFVPEVQATPVVQTPIKTSPTIVYKDIEMAVVANVSSRNESEYGADTKITVVYRYTKPSNIAACDYDTELKNVATGEVFKGDCSGGYITSRNYLTPGSYKFEIYSPMYNLRQTKEFNVQ